MTKEKIAILGGGIGALTAAFELTTVENWQDKYDITIYQMGWRLGGKGASGRDIQNPFCIQEHGLHIWFGVYENAFNVMWRAYDALNRPKDAPFPTVESAFLPLNTVTVMDNFKGDWQPWNFTLPPNPQFPGKPVNPNEPDKVTPRPSIWSYFIEILEVLHEFFGKSELKNHAATTPTVEEHPHWWQKVIDKIEDKVKDTVGHFETDLLNYALHFAKTIGEDIAKQVDHADHNILKNILKHFKDWICEHLTSYAETSRTAQREVQFLDLGAAIAFGMLEDGVLADGWDAINQYDFKQWLAKSGACEITVNSSLVNALYGLLFGYEGGDTEKPNMVAGNLMRIVLIMVLEYKGSVLYKMNAGMGDIVVAPIYLTLKRRGVKFKFFHKVTNVKADGDQISEIDVAEQVTLKVDEYDPLILVEGLPCWPNVPLYDQITQGKELQEKHVNLESHWANWGERQQ